MIPYFLVLLLILICAIYDQKSNNNSFKLLVFFVLTLFAGLRCGVGIDYTSYIAIFEEDIYGKEPGRGIMISVIKSIGGTGQLYIFVMALITQFFTYKTLIKFEKDYFWFLIIIYYCISLFYIASFNASRQYMAISIMLWGFQYINKNKWLFMIITLLAGFGCHYSALMFIPLFFFLIRPHSKTSIIVILVSLLFVGSIFVHLISYTPYAKYEVYLENDTDDRNIQITQYLLAALSFALIFAKDKFPKYKENVILVNLNNLCLFSIILVIIQESGHFKMLFQRFNNYFVYSYLLIIPALLSSMDKRRESLWKLLIVFFSFGYFLMTIIVRGEHHILVPYGMNFNLF